MIVSDLLWTTGTARLDSLQLWERNPKTMSKARAQRLLKSWQEMGQYQTLAIGPQGECYDGTQRVLALRAAGYKGDYEVAVRRSNRALTESERERLVIESTVGTVGMLDWDALAGWDDLEQWGLDAEALAAWNNDAANMALLLETAETEAPPEDVPIATDRAEELQEKWQVQPGDIWQAGEHFVICGDCRESETWARLLAAAGVKKVNGVFTSPPYAMQRKEQYGGVPTEEYVEWWDAVQSNVKANLAADGSFFVNIKPHCEDGERVLYVFDLVLAMRRRWGWRYVDELCWKHQGIMGKWGNRFKNQFEPVYHFSISQSIKLNHENVIVEFSKNSGELSTYNGIDNAPAKTGSPFKQSHKKSNVFDGALPGNVISVNLGATATDTGNFQAAAFPVALPAFFVKAYSDAGDVWCDPFCSSGTTIVSAHQHNRRGLGIEKLEKYVSVILERLSQLGLQPVKVSQA